MKTYRLSPPLPLQVLVKPATITIIISSSSSSSRRRRRILRISLPGKHTTRTIAGTDHILTSLNLHPGVYVDPNRDRPHLLTP